MNILVTGSSGFIATYFFNKLSSKNKFFGIDLRNSKNTKFLQDVRNEIKSSEFPKKIDLIINLAAIHREPGHNDHEYFETNILGAETITELAEKVKCNRIIFTSSISPYGIENKLKDENTIPCPKTPYGSSKLAAEKIHIAWQNRDKKNRILTISLN